jgi:hypothetical protein
MPALSVEAQGTAEVRALTFSGYYGKKMDKKSNR